LDKRLKNTLRHVSCHNALDGRTDAAAVQRVTEFVRSVGSTMIARSNAGFQSAAGRIRRGKPELSGMASNLPISQKSGSRLRPAAAGLWRAKGCLGYGVIFDT
jgi:hypothetical protein